MRVLVVDDEPLIRRSLEKAFTLRGHSVRTSVDGPTGLVAWRDFHPDVVLLDVLMPGLSGPQVLEQMGHPQDTKVVLMSAFSGEYDVATAQSLGADDFIAKPFANIFTIVEQIESLVSNSALKNTK